MQWNPVPTSHHQLHTPRILSHDLLECEMREKRLVGILVPLFIACEIKCLSFQNIEKKTNKSKKKFINSQEYILDIKHFVPKTILK